jgi:hypothetical protein
VVAVMLEMLECLDDIGMVERAQRLGLTAEAFSQFRLHHNPVAMQPLECDPVFGFDVGAEIDRAHAAGAKFSVKRIAPGDNGHVPALCLHQHDG